MIRRLALASALAAVVLGTGPVVGAASAASTTTARFPTTAALVNAQGVANGCRAIAPPLWEHDKGQQGDLVYSPTRVTCPVTADAHFLHFGSAVWQVRPDGSRVQVVPFDWRDYATTPPGGAPITALRFQSGFACSTFGWTGSITVTFIERVQARTIRSSTDTFAATVERTQTITCG